MKVNLKKIEGNWELGYALDKHTVNSQFIGYDEYGYGRWDNIRSKAGEALYQLKYKHDFTQVEALAQTIVNEIAIPFFPKIGFVVPMPASKHRELQPVTELAEQVAKLIGVYSINTLIKNSTGVSLKDLSTKKEKEAEISGAFSVVDRITNEGPWDVLLIDDLFDTGATMEAACQALGSYNKVNRIYVATISWK